MSDQFPPGTLVHDRGELPDEGWFIVGETPTSYFNVNNGVCVEAHPEDVSPWTDKYFESFGLVSDLAQAASRIRSAR